jgi:dTDP-4-dehydrorhamnose 3,5-epimerase
MSARFGSIDTPIQGLRVIERRPVGDERGNLERLFCAEELHDFFAGRSIVQINHTHTVKSGTVRGMHYQRPPYAEMKMVSCVRGEVFDVAVDLRKGSPTFLRWHAELLRPDNHKALLIPEGFAHGFQALTDDCELLYFHTAAYHRAAEGGLHSQDPALAIRWPKAVSGLSARDAAHPLLDGSFRGLDI